MKTGKDILIEKFYEVNRPYVRLNFINEFVNEKTENWSKDDIEQFFKQSLTIETANRDSIRI